MSKKISINPNFFKIGGRSSLKSNRKKVKPMISARTLKPNDIKKKLIEKIKEHQKKEKDKMLEEQRKKDDTFKNDFEETINYLDSMSKKKNEKKRKKRTLRKMDKNAQNTKIKSENLSQNILKNSSKLEKPSVSNIPVHIGSMNSSNDPPYGCLKGGTKPTWRQWNKTLKKEKVESQNDNKKETTFNIPFDILKNEDNLERQKKLHQLKNKFLLPDPTKNRIRTRRVRRKITLGKKGNKVGVLVKSKQTRKIIKNEVTVLKKKSIQEVKNYLRKHNLVKIGSNAPDHIFRSIYESAYLSGDIKNKNPDILLHNWHKEIEE